MNNLLRRAKEGSPESTDVSKSTGVCDSIVIVDIDIVPSTFHSAAVIDQYTWKKEEYDISLVKQMNKENFNTSSSQPIQPKPSEEVTSPILFTASSVPEMVARKKIPESSRPSAKSK